MGLAADIIDFFSVYENITSTPKSVEAFLEETDQFENCSEVKKIIRRLTQEGWLIPAGFSASSLVLFHDTYYSYSEVEPVEQDYGTYEFLVFGFPYIRNHFVTTVKPVVVKKIDGSDDIGSGFLLNYPSFKNSLFVTAKHCIENMQEVSIPEWNCANIPLLNIWTPSDERVDLAVIEFEGDAFPKIPSFHISNANILDDILTMGYPPIPGFESVLIAETAQIAGHLKSTTGQIIGKEKAYLDQQNYFLISARVKGGNSGGPVINQYGKVVGVVCQLPAEAEGRTDILGYGCAIPTETLRDFLQACIEQSDTVTKVKFQMTPDGFRTALG